MAEELLSLEIDEKRKKKILSNVNRYFSAASDNRSQYDSMFEEVRDAYMAFTREERIKKKKNKKEKTLETVAYPLCFSDAEHAAARFATSIFSQRPYVVALPRQEQDVESAQLATDLLDFHSYKDQLYTKYYEVLKYMMIYGTGIYKVFWDIGIDDYVNSSQIDMPRIMPVSIFNFFPDPMATSSETMRYCFEIAERDFEWVIQMIEKGVYNVSKEDIDKLIKAKREIRSITRNQGTLTFGERKINVKLKSGIPFFEIREYVGWIDIEGNGKPIQTFITTLDDVLILRITPNPYGFNPYISVRDTILPGEFYGVGEVEPIIPIQSVIGDVINSRLRNVNLIVNRMFKVLKTSGLKVENIASLPGRVFRVRTHQDIEPIVTQDVTQSSYIEVNQLLDAAHRTLGSQPQNIGIPVSKRQTGLEVATLADTGSARDRAKLLSVEVEGITRHSRFIIELYKKFLETPVQLRILENENFSFQEVGSEDLSSDFDFIALGSSIDPIANRAIRRRELLEVFQIVAQDPTVNRRALYKMIFRAYDVKNVSEILPPVQQAPVPQGGQPQARRLQDIAALLSR